MNFEDDLFAERNEFNFESKLIRNDNKNIYNRLCSIVDDATFVMKVADIMPSLALIGELILFNAKLYIFSINEKSQQQMSVVDLGTLIAQR
ncbi:hypothetical protein PS6_007024 [Mucor atramentarius]